MLSNDMRYLSGVPIHPIFPDPTQRPIVAQPLSGLFHHQGGKGDSAPDTKLLIDVMQVNFDGPFGDI